jgi:LmbE family N-acetylglucosaminyl deacetylase
VRVIPLHLPPGQLRLVCLGAHPDDIEIGCGATLLTLAEAREVSVTVVVATGADGERHEEAVKAAARFLPAAEAEVNVLGFRDGFLPSEWGTVKEAFEEIARSGTAEMVFAPRRDDAHQDHRVVAELATTVWRDALVMRYEIPKWDGDLRPVSHYVPLTPELARRKVELLDESFPSQGGRDWWDAETFLGLMRLRGVECRSRYAEAFLVDKAVIALG